MEPRTAIVLGGGGARAAYQVGALRAIARVHARRGPLPFPVVCGTSAGAINAAALAQHADDFRCAVARLTRWWRRVSVDDIYRSDLASLSRHSARFLASVLSGAQPPSGVASVLDNAPLAKLLASDFTLSRLADHIERGDLLALAVNATSYTTGHAVSFFQASAAVAGWQRMRRRGVPTVLTEAHLLASAAIPFLFPPARIGQDYYMDGSVRQLTPLSAPLNLGARRVLVIAVGQFGGQRPPPDMESVRFPSFAQAAGHALSTIFLDNLAADVERMMHVNRLVKLIPPQTLAASRLVVGHVDALVLAPSRDIGGLALEHVHRLPNAVRTLLRGLGSTQGTGANLTSYLMFDREFCRALLKLGYADTMARRAEVHDFLAGSRSDAPMLPANFA